MEVTFVIVDGPLALEHMKFTTRKKNELCPDLNEKVTPVVAFESSADNSDHDTPRQENELSPDLYEKVTLVVAFESSARNDDYVTPRTGNELYADLENTVTWLTALNQVQRTVTIILKRKK